MSASHIASLSTYCLGLSGCNRLAYDPRSKIGPVPIAAFGVAGYLLLIVIAILWASHKTHADKWKGAGIVVSLLGTAASVVLVYTLVFTIKTVCIWCLASALTMSCTLALWSVESRAPSIPTRSSVAGAVGTFLALSIAYWGLYQPRRLFETHDEQALQRMPIAEFVPRDSLLVGNAAAHRWIVVFSDLECPACHKEVPEMIEAASPHSNTALLLRHFPLKGHPNAMWAAVAMETLPSNEKKLKFLLNCSASSPAQRKDYEPLLRAEGSNGAAADRALASASVSYLRVRRDLAFGNEISLQGTPMAFLIDEKGTKRLVSQKEALVALKGE